MHSKILQDRGSSISREKADRFERETSKERKVSRVVGTYDPDEVFTSESIKMWCDTIP